MKVTQITTSRFWHFHLARQLERFDILDKIYSGYPSFKLKDEVGIDKSKIITFPWVHAPYMKRGILGLDKSDYLNKEWEWLVKQSLDKYVSANIKQPTLLIGLSGSALESGKKTKKLGGIFICDRGSSHIRFQNDILNEEYKMWGFEFKGIDPRVIVKEESEYELADRITVPSEFVRQSFIKMGVPENKIIKISYGARLDRFQKTSEPSENNFSVLWVGGVSIRKGFIYALEAFQKLNCTKKEFIVVGHIEHEVKLLLKNKDLSHVIFLGTISNYKLPELYSKSHVFLISSIEEGLAMVQGEALACGCPVIATENTGAEDLYTDGVEGFIVPIRSSQAIADKLQLLADDFSLRKRMSDAALIKVKDIGGWDNYGENWSKLISNLQ
jgi:glycosyltransferase involved in cell wall biosynthesis